MPAAGCSGAYITLGTWWRAATSSSTPSTSHALTSTLALVSELWTVPQCRQLSSMAGCQHCGWHTVQASGSCGSEGGRLFKSALWVSGDCPAGRQAEILYFCSSWRGSWCGWGAAIPQDLLQQDGGQPGRPSVSSMLQASKSSSLTVRTVQVEGGQPVVWPSTLHHKAPAASGGQHRWASTLANWSNGTATKRSITQSLRHKT
jgi:hypothetical protein